MFVVKVRLIFVCFYIVPAAQDVLSVSAEHTGSCADSNDFEMTKKGI